MTKIVEIGKHRDGVIAADLESACNSHIAITGKTGTGKSVAGQKLLRNIAAEELSPIIVFDFHRLFASENLYGNFRDDIMAMTNNVNVYSDGISLPLFTPIRSIDGREEDMLDVLIDFVDAISVATKLGSRQRECLFQATEFVIESGTYPKEGIKALNYALNAADDERAATIQDKLRYIFGKNVFRESENKLIKPRSINVLRLSDFPLSTQMLVAEIVLAYLWRLANAGMFLESGLCIYLDECQVLNWGKTGTLSTILREGRKMGLQLILTTQTLERKSELTRCMLQAGTQLYFSPSEGEVTTVAKILGEKRRIYWQMQLRSLMVGECIANGTFQINGVSYTGPVKLKI